MKWKWEIDPNKVLDRMEKAIKRKILRKAMTKASQLINKELKRAAPIREKRSANSPIGGTMKRSMSYKVYRGRVEEKIIGVIGPMSSVRKRIQKVRLRFKIGTKQGKFSRGKRVGEDRFIIPAKYFHLVNKGVNRRDGGRNRPNPFASRVMDTHGQRASDAMTNTIRDELAKEMA